MRLPRRTLSYAAEQDQKPNNCDQVRSQSVALDSEIGAIVPVDSEMRIVSSPERNSRSIPIELAGLHEKYSSTCRLFEYQELVSATSNFLPDNLMGKEEVVRFIEDAFLMERNLLFYKKALTANGLYLASFIAKHER